ncbi:hypothetical protein ENUP19_0274G0033 [Entamoeba nuttalli]|uniref:Transporter, major facilitator family protein n=2 Tax=Entamoeba nuttalli TaxID=412467 RepID=K2HD96_ENTNP|nr:transporter, major facilitator family protein [Entamoeba nuttalli P19]EKE40714.1 transporter, major facilitator family protein [Entamoeba nuttalli P19]|eukprot:XP_008856950.1 transporter, major facilitator family protein [Entamoeba nuttalli P19]
MDKSKKNVQPLVIEKNSLRHKYYHILRLKHFKCWRVMTLIAGFMLMLVGGSIFSWSAYNIDLCEQMGYSFTQLNTLFSIGLLGVYFSLLSGFLFDNFGPRGTLIFSFIFGTIGYLLFALQVSFRFSSVTILSYLFLFIATQGCGALFQTAIQTSSHNFPRNIRATIIGIITCGFPLSGSIYSFIYTSIFKNLNGGVHDYLFFLCLTTCIGSFIGMVIMFIIPTDDPNNTSYSLTSSSYPNNVNNNEPFSLSTEVSNQSLIDSQNTNISLNEIEYQQTSIKSQKNVLTDNESQNTQETSIQDPELNTSVQEFPQKQVKKCNTLKVFLQLDFYIYTIAIALVSGPSLSFISNVSLILQSNGINNSRIELLTGITSLFHAIGIFLFCYGSDLLAKFHINKLMILSFLSFILLILFSLVVLLQSFVIEVITWIIPWFVGGILGVSLSLISERFGVNNFGFNLGITLTVVAVSNIFISIISGVFYDAYIKSGDSICTGEICFHYTFIISAGMVVCSFILFSFLVVKKFFTMKRQK